MGAGHSQHVSLALAPGQYEPGSRISGTVLISSPGAVEVGEVCLRVKGVAHTSVRTEEWRDEDCCDGVRSPLVDGRGHHQHGHGHHRQLGHGRCDSDDGMSGQRRHGHGHHRQLGRGRCDSDDGMSGQRRVRVARTYCDKDEVACYHIPLVSSQGTFLSYDSRNYQLPFEFVLPEPLPATMAVAGRGSDIRARCVPHGGTVLEYTACVDYHIRASVRTSRGWVDGQSQPLHVVAPGPQYTEGTMMASDTVTVRNCCFGRGKASLEIASAQAVAVVGQPYQLLVAVDNSESTVEVREGCAKLVSQVKIRCAGIDITHERTLGRACFDGLPAGAQKLSYRVTLPVSDADMCPARSSLIDVAYLVRATLETRGMCTTNPRVESEVGFMTSRQVLLQQQMAALQAMYEQQVAFQQPHTVPGVMVDAPIVVVAPSAPAGCTAQPLVQGVLVQGEPAGANSMTIVPGQPLLVQ